MMVMETNELSQHIHDGIVLLCARSNQLAISKGFIVDPEHGIDRALLLVVSEITEAQDALRDGCKPDEEWEREDGKPEGFASELADAVIRICNLCGSLGIDLASAIEKKHAFNAGRPFKHGRAF